MTSLFHSSYCTATWSGKKTVLYFFWKRWAIFKISAMASNKKKSLICIPTFSSLLPSTATRSFWTFLFLIKHQTPEHWPLQVYLLRVCALQNQSLRNYGRPKGDSEVRVTSVDKRAKQDRWDDESVRFWTQSLRVTKASPQAFSFCFLCFSLDLLPQAHFPVWLGRDRMQTARR